MKIRTRIAPSPTGFFHIGNARTALFNYLFAKKLNGEFLLRIEDTDAERSKKAYEDNIINGLKWLGLNWDGEIIRQSEKTAVYKKYLNKLLDEQKAFYCFHTQDQLEREQKNQELEKIAFKHECDHKNMSASEVEERLKNRGIIRLKNTNKKIIFNDLVRGEMIFESGLLGDFSLAKNLDEPLYNFAVVVDDHEMQITHVIRGEDHLSNTPKQILVQEALGFEQPHYAYLPLILGPDRSKLSKRHGGTALIEYRDQGYLPAAMINFMALLGWHPVHNQEIFTLEELIKEFDLKKAQKGGAVFDINKLDSINSHYIKQLSNDVLADKLKPYLKEFNLNPGQLEKIARSFKDRLKNFSEIKTLCSDIFNLADYSADLLVWKNSDKKTAAANLETAKDVILKIADDQFDLDCITTDLMAAAEEKGRGEFLWPLRIALSGAEKSPSPFELINILGQKESIVRINSAIRKLTL